MPHCSHAILKYILVWIQNSPFCTLTKVIGYMHLGLNSSGRQREKDLIKDAWAQWLEWCLGTRRLEQFRDLRIQRCTVHCMHHYDDNRSMKTFHMIYIVVYLHIFIVHVKIVQWSNHSVAGTLCHFINLAEAMWMLLIIEFHGTFLPSLTQVMYIAVPQFRRSLGMGCYLLKSLVPNTFKSIQNTIHLDASSYLTIPVWKARCLKFF